MSKVTITHTCGHSQTHTLFGKMDERDRKEQWLKEGVCTECYRLQQSKAAAEASKDLPALTGSEKQIAWANKIRLEQINAPEMVKLTEQGQSVKTRWIADNTSAKYWIDNRNNTAVQNLRAFGSSTQAQ